MSLHKRETNSSEIESEVGTASELYMIYDGMVYGMNGFF